MKKYLFPLLAAIMFTSSCKKEEDQAEQDKQEILDYIDRNNLNASSTASGLYYIIENQGTGKAAGPKSDVQVIYKGYFTNGSVFDEYGSPGLWLNLQQVIAGWQEGIQLFKEGGSGKLLIPSALGYGDTRSGSVPPNSVLIFDITLRDVR